MKFFAVIMAMLILGLSVLPCRDDAFKDHAKYSMLEVSHNEDGHNEGHADNCSPLCICSCCSVVTVYNTPILIELPNFENRIEHVSCYSGALINISLPVWQPPQLIA